MSVAAIIEHGSLGPLLEDLDITRRRDGLDSATASIFTDSLTTYTQGAAFPGYAGMQILEVNSKLDCITDSLAERWMHRLSGIGVAGTKAERLLSEQLNAKLDAFDEATQVWLTTNKNKLQVGSRMPGYANMVCLSAQPETLEVPGWYRVTGQFKGLLGNKPVSRAISSNVEYVQKDSIIWLGAGGWTDPQKGVFCTPQVVITFRYWTTYTPVKGLPEQGGAAPGELFPVIEISGVEPTGATYHWPNGWFRSAFAPTPIPGTTITETVEVWTYQQRITI